MNNIGFEAGSQEDDYTLGKGKIVETKFGRVDIDKLDTFQFEYKYDPVTGTTVEMEDMRFKHTALLERLNPQNNMPNFNEFRKTFGIRDDAIAVEEYISFTHNHINMIKAQHISGLTFDTKTHLSSYQEAVKSTQLFSDEKVIDVFRRGKEIEVSNRFFKEVSFFDPVKKPYESKDTLALKEVMKDTPFGYNPPDPRNDKDIGKFFISTTADKNLFTNGGYFHEKFHAQLRERHNDEFRDLEERFDLQRNEGLNAVVKSFEEVASHVRTFEFMEQDERYVNNLYDKYKLSDLSKIGVDRVIFDALDGLNQPDKFNDNFSFLIEMVGTFKYVDNSTYDNIKSSIERHKNIIDPEKYSLLNDLSTRIEEVGSSDEFIPILKSSLEIFKKGVG